MGDYIDELSVFTYHEYEYAREPPSQWNAEKHIYESAFKNSPGRPILRMMINKTKLRAKRKQERQNKKKGRK